MLGKLLTSLFSRPVLGQVLQTLFIAGRSRTFEAV